MALTVSSTVTEFQLPINAILQQDLLRNAKPRAPYFIGSVPGTMSVPSGGSSTVKWRRYNTSADNASGPAPSTTALTEVATASYMQGRTPITAHFSDVTATVAKYGQFFVFSEEVDIFSGWTTQNSKMMEVLGILAGRSLNQLHRNTLETNGTEVMANSAASEGAIDKAVSATDIAGILILLDTNMALTFATAVAAGMGQGSTPLLSSFWAICHPHVAYDVAGLAGFKSVESYMDRVEIVDGEFGYWGRAGIGCRFISTQDASINAQGGAAIGSTGLRGATNIDTYTTVIYGMDYSGSVGLRQQQTVGNFTAGMDNPDVIEVIVQGLGSGGTSDPLREISTLAYKVWYAGNVLNANWGRNLISGATSV